MWSLVAVHMDSSARSRQCSLPQPCISLVQVVGRVPAPPLRDCFLRHRWNEVTWGECRVNVKLHQRHRDTQTHADVHTYIQRLHTHVHTETHQHIDTCTHPHTHTHTHTPFPPRQSPWASILFAFSQVGWMARKSLTFISSASIY